MSDHATDFPRDYSERPTEEHDGTGKNPLDARIFGIQWADPRSSYERQIETLDIYPTTLPHEVFLCLGLAGEAGEVVDKIKKLYRANGAPIAITSQDIALEIGDALWYLTRLANVLGFTMKEVMDMNLKKLHARHARGTIHGEGDSR